ncbi:MAG TPA: hypothetical protein VFF06_08865 [Polyangia bacterium]|nr:hypothetical protein [Polyangia bacterium]
MTRELFFACALAAASPLAGCGDTTGSALFNFAATAAGPTDAVNGQPLEVAMTGSGFHLAITSAKIHVGAAYLASAGQASGAPAGACTLALDPSAYVGQVFGPLDVDLLSPDPIAFPAKGQTIAAPTKVGEVWLTGGDVDTIADSTVILHVEGTADRGGVFYPFIADVTIGENRLKPVQNPGLPGSAPICQQRIVTPIAIDVTPTVGGSLQLRIDPRGMFNEVDFTSTDVTKVSDSPLLYRIPDAKGGAGGALFDGLRSNSSVYSFIWSN